MQQIRQRMFVMHVGRRHHRAVCQPALAGHPDVQLHAEVPLLALAGLVHLRVACLVGILGRAGRANDGGVHDGAGIDLEAAGLQFLSNLGAFAAALFMGAQDLSTWFHAWNELKAASERITFVNLPTKQ